MQPSAPADPAAILPGVARRATLRLALRPIEAGDLDFLAGIFADPRMTAHRPDPAPDPRAVVAERLERDLAQWRALGFGRWLALEGETPVGAVGLSPGLDEDELNLGYHVAPAAWGRGIAAEMAGEAVNVAFGPLGAARLVALIRTANPASARVAGKLGFRFVQDVPLGGAPTRLFVLERPAA